MDYYEIRNLFSYLEDNSNNLSTLQNEYVTNVRRHYKWTGAITPGQIDNLLTIKEKISTLVNYE